MQLLADASKVPVNLEQMCEVHGKLLAAVKRHGASPAFASTTSGRWNASNMADITSGGPFEKYVFLLKKYFANDFPASYDFAPAAIKSKFLAVVHGFSADDNAGPWKSMFLRKMCAVLIPCAAFVVLMAVHLGSVGSRGCTGFSARKARMLTA